MCFLADRFTEQGVRSISRSILRRTVASSIYTVGYEVISLLGLHGDNLFFNNLPVYLIFNIFFYIHLYLFWTYFLLIRPIAIKQLLLIFSWSFNGHFLDDLWWLTYLQRIFIVTMFQRAFKFLLIFVAVFNLDNWTKLFILTNHFFITRLFAHLFFWQSFHTLLFTFTIG